MWCGLDVLVDFGCVGYYVGVYYVVEVGFVFGLVL